MPPVLVFGPFTIASYTAALSVALAASALIGWRLWTGAPRAWWTICVFALAGGVLGGRLAHVVAHWDYFQNAVGEALRVNGGGLDWWGAALGGLAGVGLAARLLRVPAAPALDALTPAIPLLALAGSIGCAAAACAVGREVPTLAGVSPLVAAELPDGYGLFAPRYQTQLWQALWALLLLGWVALVFWRGWVKRARFWITLALLAAGMLVIARFRI